MYCLDWLVYCSFRGLSNAVSELNVQSKVVLCSVLKSDSVHVGVALQVSPQVVQAGVGLGADLAVVRSDA